MSSTFTLGIILSYFLVLILLARITSRKANAHDFYNANKSASWFLVAFGMVGTTLSGVTFISVPGWVGDTGFGYFQMVLGYIFGYLFVVCRAMNAGRPVSCPCG